MEDNLTSADPQSYITNGSQVLKRLEQIGNKISKIMKKFESKSCTETHNNSGAIQCIELPLDIIGGSLKRNQQ